MPPIRADYLLTSLVPKEKADDSLGTLPLDNEKIILRSTHYASNARATINTVESDWDIRKMNATATAPDADISMAAVDSHFF